MGHKLTADPILFNQCNGKKYIYIHCLGIHWIFLSIKIQSSLIPPRSTYTEMIGEPWDKAILRACVVIIN